MSTLFVGKSFISSLTNNSVIVYRDLRDPIYFVILFLIFASIPIAFIIRLVVKADIDKKRLNEQKQREDELKTYIIMIEKINQDLRKIKHDVNNVFSTFDGYLNEEQVRTDALRAYFTNVQDEFGLLKLPSYPTVNLERLKDPELLGLLLNKIVKASDLKVQLSIEITEDIRFPKFLMVDIVRIIGILLDNAIEESAKVVDGKTQIAFIPSDHDLIIVKIRNSHDNPAFITEYLSGSLKSSKGEDRGLGLDIVQELIRSKKQLDLECRQTDVVEFTLLIKGKKGSGDNR